MDTTTAPATTYPTVPGTSRPEHIGWDTLAPTAPNQRVRFTSYGGLVTQAHVGREGTVVRINRAGNPVIALDGLYDERTGRWHIGGRSLATCEVTDRFGCAKLIDPDGKVIQIQVATR